MPARLRLRLVPHARVLLHAPHRKQPLPLAEPPTARRRGEVRQYEYRAERDEDGERALEEEEPAPRGAPELAVHAVEDARGEERAEGVADDVAAVEDRGAQAQFAAFVPFADEEEGAGEEGRFDEAEEEAGEEGTCEAIDASAVAVGEDVRRPTFW